MGQSSRERVEVRTMGIANSLVTRSAARGRIEKDVCGIQVPTEGKGVVVSTNGDTESNIPRASPVRGIRHATPCQPGSRDVRVSDQQAGTRTSEATLGRENYLRKLRQSTPRRTTRAAARLKYFNTIGMRQELPDETPLMPTQSSASKKRTGSRTRAPTPAKSKRARASAPCRAAVVFLRPGTTKGDKHIPSPTLRTCRTPAGSKRNRPAPTSSELPPPSKSLSCPQPLSPAIPVRRKKRAWNTSDMGIGALTCEAIRTVIPRDGSEAIEAGGRKDTLIVDHFPQDIFSTMSILAQNIGTWEGTGVLPLCAEYGCMAPASYGFMESGRVDFCGKHAVIAGMVNLLDRCWGLDGDDCNDSTMRICSTWSVPDNFHNISSP